MIGCLCAEWSWNRYEYQGRDAAHTHGAIKLKNGPHLEKLVVKIWAGRYAERLIAAHNAARRGPVLCAVLPWYGLRRGCGSQRPWYGLRARRTRLAEACFVKPRPASRGR